ncbi:HlyD family efflux transporter periplasmic adaptor subunit [Candidatus Nomurabacteria bacterium]|nr:HlyD family efflux transporter periplasmic adaptor subunit [Candidatus Kaiserbacteria bacterium]MCB9814483.1 HlyD family efflux transporter periplasmic adaptor subunit [Candidatus Nomurabacteria bacterium]
MSHLIKVFKANKYILLLLLAVTALTFGIKFQVNSVLAEKESIVSDTKEEFYKVEAVSQFPVAVSGIVKASDSVIVRAKTAGEVKSIYVQEGAVVPAGTMLALQDTPISNAQYELAQAQAGLSAVQSEALLSTRQAALEQQQELVFSAKEIAVLRQSGNDDQVIESIKQLATTLDGAITNLSATMDFVDQNKSFFSAAGMAEYREIVLALYNKQPNYLSSGIGYSVINSDDIINKLRDTKSKGDFDAVEIQSLAVLVDAQLNAATELLGTGENDIFDQKKVSSSDAIYTQYLAYREAVIETEGNVRSAMAEVRSSTSRLNEDLVQQGKSVEITKIDAEEASKQVFFATKTTKAEAQVANNRVALAAAETSLGSVRAPFGGVVSVVQADAGEYLQPGSPIMTLVGMAGKELIVSVPASFVNSLKTGQEFIKNDQVVGYVDRFSPIAEQGSLRVIIDVVEESVVIGDSVSGYILIDEEMSDLVSVPRAYLHFSSIGTSVYTENKERIPVDIEYDFGETVFVSGVVKPDTTLVSTVSGRL